MLLAIDIGNTNTGFGVFKDSRLVRRFDIPTRSCTKRKLKVSLGGYCIEDAIICSVVPHATKATSAVVKGLIGRRPYIIGKDVRVPIRNLYRRPRQVGQDRLVNAYAGCILYGAPLVVIDFGTAVTFDIISKNREYLGGMILPGLAISLDALNERTALLPKIKLSKPKEFIGRDTKASMLSGIVYGFAALTDDLAMRIKTKIGKNASVIGTGGNIDLIAKYCKIFDKIDRDLTLKGLSLIFNKRKELV